MDATDLSEGMESIERNARVQAQLVEDAVRNFRAGVPLDRPIGIATKQITEMMA